MDLKQLVLQANELDKQSKFKEADLLDRQIKRRAFIAESADMFPPMKVRLPENEKAIVVKSVEFLKKLSKEQPERFEPGLQLLWKKWQTIRESKPGVKSFAWNFLKAIFNDYLNPSNKYGGTNSPQFEKAIKDLGNLTH